MNLEIADMFCGAGGTSTGAIEAARWLGYSPRLTAINHWPRAIETHTENHPGARHLCTSVDNINPRDLYREGELDLLWASPECTHHSVARGGKPINDQSRSTAWCVVRWAEALRPGTILVENVPEFIGWGGIGADGRPLKSKRGATFGAWVTALESLGYRVQWRILCAADYGDPTTRRVVKPRKIHADYGAPRMRDAWLDHSYEPPCVKVPYGDEKSSVVAHRHFSPWEVGDRLWVREAWRTGKTLDKYSPGLIQELADEAGYSSGLRCPLLYLADNQHRVWSDRAALDLQDFGEWGRYRCARFMPRWASRITLEVTGVRVERLQEISPADCDAEGIERLATHTMDGAGRLARVKTYRAIWEGLNGPDSWEADPFVWVVQFRRVAS